MSKVVKTGEFFVVGGPVQPDRPCYLPRAADRQLVDAIGDGDFCYVLGPRAMGKSSLMGRTVRLLRGEGQLAAVIDLAQLGAREQGAEAGRWYYSIAYRVMRELRLKVDLQSWWQENSVLTREQRLVEFFLEVVLANTTTTVTVFIDEIERTLDLAYAQELFGTIRAIYNARASEPEYGRLNFVVLGTASPRVLCPQPDLSPFQLGQTILLEDFSVAETQPLALGLGIDPELAGPVLERIHYWAAGQPYLTQKISRTLSRLDMHGATVDIVDELIRDRFLGSGVVQAEPLFNAIAASLTGRSGLTRQSLILLGKLQKGQVIEADNNSGIQEHLCLSGVVLESGGILVVRNRIYAGVFTSRWVNSVLPFDLKVLAVTVAAIAAAVLVPVWYTQFLPRPYVATLAAATQDYEVVVEAHRKLARLPGFESIADGLLGDVMVRRSRLATSFADMESAEQALLAMPGNEAIGEQLRAEFWYRKAVVAMAAENRDEALLFALEAESLPSGAGRALVEELAEPDYRQLKLTLGINGPATAFAADWQRGRIVLIDRDKRAQTFDLATASRMMPEPLRLTATQVLQVSRELLVDEPLRAEGLALWIEVDHPQPQEISLSVRLPDGSTLEEALPAGRSSVRFGLRGVAAAANLQGIWRLALADTGGEASGQLRRWGIARANQEILVDVPEDGLAIPNPIQTDEINVALSANGRWALASPVRADAGGAMTQWDLDQQRIVRHYPVSKAPTMFGFAADSQRVYWCCDKGLVLDDVVENGASRRQVIAPASAAHHSPDGDYLAVLDSSNATKTLQLIRSADARVVASVQLQVPVAKWSLGAAGEIVALAEAEGVVNLLDVRQGRSLGSVKLSANVERLASGPKGFVAVTADQGLWWIVRSEGDVINAEYLGLSDGGVAVADDQLAYLASGGLIKHVDLARRAVRVLRHEAQPSDLSMLLLGPDGELVLADSRILRFWRFDEPSAHTVATSHLTSAALDSEGELYLLGDALGHVRPMIVDSAVEEGGLDYIGHGGPVTSLASLSLSDIAASGGADSAVRLWSLSSGAPREHFMRHPAGAVSTVALSSNGRWLASGADYAARVWNTADAELVSEIAVTGKVTALVFAPTNDLLAVGDIAGNLQWVVPRANVPMRAARAKGEVTAIAFASDGELVASGTINGSLQLWNVASAAPVGTGLELGHRIRAIAFSADGRFVIAQTLHWIHWLQFVGESLQIESSRLAPLAARPGPVALGRDGSRLRLLSAYHSRPSVTRFERNRRPVPLAEPAGRWRPSHRALGLGLSADGEPRRR